jgi:uncharacterized protein (TIGR02594 family)
MKVMKRSVQTLIVFAAMTTVATSAFANKKKEERFVLTAAVEQTHRADNTAAVSLSAPKLDKKDAVFAIGLEALKWIGATSKQVGVPYPELWCADFINFILRRTGHATTNSRAAKSFLEYGKRIDQPRVGAIVVLARGKNGGHVGIVRGTDGADKIIVISGNHGNKVWESMYPKNRVLGYVIPPELD